MPKSVLKILGVAFLFYAAMVLMLAGCQRHLIYYPSRGGEAQLLQVAEETGMAPWRNAEGEIIGWKASARGGEEEEVRTVVVFHGNAGYALHRGYFVNGFQTLPGAWEVYVFEYPGYGSRAGRPSEARIVAGAEEAMGQLAREGRTGLYLVGESLGSGVATAMAERFPENTSGLLLVTPFTTLADVGQAHYPFFPVKLLLRERYDNRGALAGYSGPVAILLAERDEVVPARLGRELYESYAGPKRLWVQEGHTHNTLDLSAGASWWREVAEFWESLSD